MKTSEEILKEQNALVKEHQESELRLKCLQIASKIFFRSNDVVVEAKRVYDFVVTGEVK